MKTIKFANKNRGLFAATLRKNVNDYFKEKNISSKGNWNIKIKSAVMLSLYLVPFILILTVSMSGWVIFPLAVLMGMAMSGIGMGVMHDAMHGSFSSKPWLNKLLGNTMYMISGHPFNWKVQHNVMHHTFTNIQGFDEDIEEKVIFRFSRHAPLKKIHRFQYLYAFFAYGIMTIYKMANDFRQLRKYNKTGITKQQGGKPVWELTKLSAGKVIYLFVGIGFPLIFSGFTWWMIILAFLIMHVTASMIMSIVFQMAHVVEEAEQPIPDRDGNIDNEWTIHQLETTANFSKNNRFFSWLIGGLNYQIEHHLFPGVCHVHYKNISPIVERTAKEFGLKYNVNPTFFTAIGSHVRMLRALGRTA